MKMRLINTLRSSLDLTWKEGHKRVLKCAQSLDRVPIEYNLE
jgi:hypothetical protein